MNNKHKIELKHLGVRIQQKRKACGLTQEEVAYPGTLHRIFDGLCRISPNK